MPDFGNDTSIHGIKFILSSENKKVFRFFWFIALIASFCGFSYYIHAAYVKWQIDPEIVMATRDRSSAEFPAPAITLCSNLFARDKKASFLKAWRMVYENLAANVTEEECMVLTANIHWCHPKYYHLVQKVCGIYGVNKVHVLETMYKTALTTSEAFHSCEFGKCDWNIYRVFTNFGICYATNMMPSSMIFTDQIHDDFKRIKTLLNNETDPSWTPEKGYRDKKPNNDPFPFKAENYGMWFQPILNKIDKENICNLKNFRVFLHKPNEIVTPFHEWIYMEYEEYMTFKILPTSHKTDVALKRFSPEIRKCYFEGEMKLKFFKTYTKALCEWECKTNVTLKKCGCVKFSMPRDKDTKVCSVKQLRCAIQIDSASCKCYAPCVDVKYTYQIDRSQLTRHTISSEIPNTTAVSMALFSITTEVIGETENYVSYKITNFISDFGGLLGLFMGCSLLTIVEILYFMANGLIEMFKRNKISPLDANWVENDDLKVHMNLLKNEMIQLRNDISDTQNTLYEICSCLKQQNQRGQQMVEKLKISK